MKNTIFAAIIFMALCCTMGCENKKTNPGVLPNSEFVTVRDGKFYLGDSVYRYLGTNFWYGAMLASEGQGGDRQRLKAELDLLDSLGITNLRILVGAEGPEGRPAKISPVLMTAPGVYNDTLLTGLDYLLSEMARRGMKAILYLNNAWEWSGGYGAYLEWAGQGTAITPGVEGYEPYCQYVSQFVMNDSAKTLALNHAKFIVSRTNSVTGRPYRDSPEIMAWQVANEPRAFSAEGKEALVAYVDTFAKLVKSLDPNHLVSSGSEGWVGCESDIALWERIHNLPEIDYGIIHLWPTNWGWANKSDLYGSLDSVYALCDKYIADHAALMAKGNKPLVLEEFGYPRDGYCHAPATAVEARDAFYRHIFDQVDSCGLAGSNFWAWGGLAVPAHDTWKPFDPYTGDPAQEPQGLYSVFAADSSTVAILKAYAASLR